MNALIQEFEELTNEYKKLEVRRSREKAWISRKMHFFLKFL